MCIYKSGVSAAEPRSIIDPVLDYHAGDANGVLVSLDVGFVGLVWGDGSSCGCGDGIRWPFRVFGWVERSGV